MGFTSCASSPSTSSRSSLSSSSQRLSLAISLASVAVVVLAFIAVVPSASADYPDVIELVGFSNRRARTHPYLPPSTGRQFDAAAAAAAVGTMANPTLPPPPAKLQADIETVKKNIEKYNKLLTLDTKNLPESQKDMLERIVERVARLKESLDIEQQQRQEQQQQQQQLNSSSKASDEQSESVTEISTLGGLETGTDSTLMLDETTLLQLQTSMDELAVAQAAVTAQTTRMRANDDIEPTMATAATTVDGSETDASDDIGETGSTGGDLAGSTITVDSLLTDATDIDDQFVAARSNNNNIAAITAADETPSSGTSTHTTTISAGNQRTLTTSGKMTKTRAATKRPAGSTKSGQSTTKRGGQRPSSSASSSSSSSSSSHHKTQGSTQKQKLPAGSTSTTQAMQKQKHQQQQQQQQHKVSHTTATVPTTDQQQQQQQQQFLTQYQRTPLGGGGGGGGASQSTVVINGGSTPAVAIAAAATSPTSEYGSNINSNNNYNNNNNDMVYDGHVNASAIIDSLNHAREEFYQQKQTVNIKDKKPTASVGGSSSSSSSLSAKPTKYHYYPHNQHIYLLPECAVQQVCNAVYVRLNYTQPLCACPSKYRDPCSASLNEDDQHTIKLVGDGKKKAITLAKTCEATTEMRECRSPEDWSLLALQNTRTGKSHYLVICRCPDHYKTLGPLPHNYPTYASVPGIRVFGMMCVKPGYAVHKPSAQPPKRYQLQKPYHRPGAQTSYIGGGSSSSSSNSGSPFAEKDSLYGQRPSYGGVSDGYHQNVHQAPSYQYLNRPEGSPLSSNSNSYRPDSLAINSFPQAGGIYGRNNERQGDAPIEAAATDDEGKLLISTSTPATAETRLPEMGNSAAGSSGGEKISRDGADGAQSEINAKREKRSIVEPASDYDLNGLPEFPWDRVFEFQRSIVWDEE